MRGLPSVTEVTFSAAGAQVWGCRDQAWGKGPFRNGKRGITLAAAPGEVCPGEAQLAAAVGCAGSSCPGRVPGCLLGRRSSGWGWSGWPFLPSAASSNGRSWLRAPWAARPGLRVGRGNGSVLPHPVLPPPCTSRGHGYGWRAGTGHAPWACLWSHWVGTWKESLGADSVSGTAFLWNLVTQLDANSRRKKSYSKP